MKESLFSNLWKVTIIMKNGFVNFRPQPTFSIGILTFIIDIEVAWWFFSIDDPLKN